MTQVARALARRTLLGLPVRHWARQFRKGALTLHGQVDAAALGVGGVPLEVQAGGLTVVGEFVGGERPTLRRLEVHGGLTLRPVDARAVSGRCMVLQDQRIELDGAPVPRDRDRIGSGELLADLVRLLADVELFARAEPDGDVVLGLGHGIEVELADGVLLTVRGATSGPADGLRLCRPLQIGFGGDGIRLAHDQLRWMSRLAEVRVERAILHPDGSVDLEGGGAKGFDRAIRGGLTTASATLSALVRSTPGLRRFLAHGRR